LRLNNKKIKRKKAQTLLTKLLINLKQKQNKQNNQVAFHLYKKSCERAEKHCFTHPNKASILLRTKEINMGP
jgi:Tfp pilus assembly pilus retraction ATPase PilT